MTNLSHQAGRLCDSIFLIEFTYARDFWELVKLRKNKIIQLYNELYTLTPITRFLLRARNSFGIFWFLSYKSNLFIKSNYDLRLIILFIIIIIIHVQTNNEK